MEKNYARTMEGYSRAQSRAGGKRSAKLRKDSKRRHDMAKLEAEHGPRLGSAMTAESGPGGWYFRYADGFVVSVGTGPDSGPVPLRFADGYMVRA